MLASPENLDLSKVSSVQIPVGSPSRGGDIAVFVLDIDQQSLPTLFVLSLCLFLSLWSFQLYFIPKFSRQLSAFSLCSSGLISALLVFSTISLSESLPQP